MARDRAARPEARPLRLFVAVEIPDRAKEVIAGAIEPLRAAHPFARWAPPENWHVTLKFLGSTWHRLVPWVEETVRTVAAACPPIEARVAGLGAFPSERRARVVWAEVNDPDGALHDLARVLDEALAAEFRTETRGFTAHVTVARSDPPLALPEGWNAADVRSEPFVIERVVVFRSHVQRPAPRYEPVVTAPFAG